MHVCWSRLRFGFNRLRIDARFKRKCFVISIMMHLMRCWCCYWRHYAWHCLIDLSFDKSDRFGICHFCTYDVRLFLLYIYLFFYVVRVYIVCFQRKYEHTAPIYDIRIYIMLTSETYHSTHFGLNRFQNSRIDSLYPESTRSPVRHARRYKTKMSNLSLSEGAGKSVNIILWNMCTRSRSCIRFL